MEKTTFGQLLRRYRRASNLTQEELATRAGISMRALSDYERDVDRSTLRRTTLVDLIAALELSGEDRAQLEQAWRRLKARKVRPIHGPSAHLLIGRDDDVDLLERHLDGAGPPVLMFAGEPGIGKTRLLDEAARLAAAREMPVLRGAALRGGALPYAPLLDAVKRHVDALPPARRRAALKGRAGLARLLPELTTDPALASVFVDAPPAWPLPPDQERRLMFDAVAGFLANVAAGTGRGPHARGVALVLDDLQWAGADALDLLIFLLRSPSLASPLSPSPHRNSRPRGARLLRVIAAYRDDEAPPGSPLTVTLADLAKDRLVARHDLRPLSLDEAARLFDTIAGDGQHKTDTAARDRAARRSGGVPFYVVSLAETIRSDRPGASHEDDDDDAAIVPWGVAQVVGQRVVALPAGARAALDVAAVAGRQSPAALLAAALGWSDAETLDALDGAARVRLLVETGARVYRFAHDLIRDIVESSVASDRRAGLHQRLAEALERSHAEGERPVEQLAYHYSRAGDESDAPAAAYLERAGDQAAARFAHAAATGYYREAVARLDRLDRAADAAGVREKLAAALRLRGRFDEAIAVLDAALDTFRALGQQVALGRVTAAIGHANVDRGTMDEAGGRVLETLAYLQEQEGDDAKRGLAALYQTLTLFFVAAGRYQEQLFAAEQAAALGREVGATGIVANATGARGHALLLLGQMDEARQALDEAIRLGEAAGDLDCLTGGHGNLASLYMWGGAFDHAERHVAEAVAAAERLDAGFLTTIATLRRAILAMYRGDWPAAHADLDWVATLDARVEGAWVFAYPVLALGTLCVLEGDWDAADRYLGESVAAGERMGDMEALRWSNVWLAERDLRAGRPAEARDRLVPLLDRPEMREAGWHELDVTALLPRLAWAHLELGDVEQAAAMAEESVERARAQEHRIALADALWVRAMVASRQQDWEEARQALEEGLAVARAMPYPYAEARILETYGLTRRAQGAIGPAGERLNAARAIFARLGARADAERVERAVENL